MWNWLDSCCSLTKWSYQGKSQNSLLGIMVTHNPVVYCGCCPTHSDPRGEMAPLFCGSSLLVIPGLCLWSPLSVFKAIFMLRLCLYRWKGHIESQIPLAATCVHSYHVFKYYTVRFQPTTLTEGTLKKEFLQKKKLFLWNSKGEI